MLAPWAQQQILNWLFNTETVGTRPTSWYVALHTGNPGSGGSNELDTGTDANYVRKAVTFDEAVLDGSAYEVESLGDVTFEPAAGGSSYTVTHITIKDALTTGNTLAIHQLTVPIPVVAATVISIPLGVLIVEGAV